MNLSSNLLADIPKYFEQKLQPIYTAREANLLAQWSVEWALQLSRTEVVLQKNRLLSESELLRFVRITDRLLKSEPIQYILGEAHFMDLMLFVDANVLIPRPETEELVEWIVSDYSGHKNLIVKDVATGSGCIALALKKYLKNAQVVGTDWSQNALVVAEKNAVSLGLDVDFRQENALESGSDTCLYNVIVSNPPYILTDEKPTMAKNVLAYEPHMALFVEKDPLEFYKKIAESAFDLLTESGALYFELHEKYGKATQDWIENNTAFATTELRQDLQGKDRMLKCLK